MFSFLHKMMLHILVMFSGGKGEGQSICSIMLRIWVAKQGLSIDLHLKGCGGRATERILMWALQLRVYENPKQYVVKSERKAEIN